MNTFPHLACLKHSSRAGRPPTTWRSRWRIPRHLHKASPVPAGAGKQDRCTLQRGQRFRAQQPKARRVETGERRTPSLASIKLKLQKTSVFNWSNGTAQGVWLRRPRASGAPVTSIYSVLSQHGSGTRGIREVCFVLGLPYPWSLITLRKREAIPLAGPGSSSPLGSFSPSLPSSWITPSPSSSWPSLLAGRVLLSSPSRPPSSSGWAPPSSERPWVVSTSIPEQ